MVVERPLEWASVCLFQVSHHPPAAAHHAISDRGWTLRQEITVASKFRGKYLSIMPLGIHKSFPPVLIEVLCKNKLVFSDSNFRFRLLAFKQRTFVLEKPFLFLFQAQFTPSLRRATITTRGRKSPPPCTTSLWESCGSTRWNSNQPLCYPTLKNSRCSEVKSAAVQTKNWKKKKPKNNKKQITAVHFKFFLFCF